MPSMRPSRLTAYALQCGSHVSVIITVSFIMVMEESRACASSLWLESDGFGPSNVLEMPKNLAWRRWNCITSLQNVNRLT